MGLGIVCFLNKFPSVSTTVFIVVIDNPKFLTNSVNDVKVLKTRDTVFTILTLICRGILYSHDMIYQVHKANIKSSFLLLMLLFWAHGFYTGLLSGYSFILSSIYFIQGLAL